MVLDLHPIRFWLDNKIQAHVTICYLGYSLLATLRYMLKSKGIDLSPLKALDELSEVYRISFAKDDNDKNDTKFDRTLFSKVITLTKSQETIIRAVSPKLLM